MRRLQSWRTEGLVWLRAFALAWNPHRNGSKVQDFARAARRLQECYRE